MGEARDSDAGAGRERIVVRGVVQGVGFRPFVYRLATRWRLAGWVRNDGDGVVVEIDGAAADRDGFVAALRCLAPPLADIHRIERSGLPAAGASREAAFRIVRSAGGRGNRALIPPDVATCADCLRELGDPDDRRFGYPFLNCTGCGPRYTIIEGLPYDRPATTMRGFALCPACREEYEDPADRRHHAQPTACPRCGPRLGLLDCRGTPLSGAAPLEGALAGLLAGEIVAVKGLGGFHLACDATDAAAVAELRRRKPRPAKPFAVMAADLDAVRAFAEVAAEEASLLTRRERPIVLLAKRVPSPLSAEVAPGVGRVGVLLPYTPLHHLLCRGAGRPLVMTSGNRRGQPLAIHTADAVACLRGVADRFLIHDRPIRARVDDSVALRAGGATRLLRRSRGYVPSPIRLPRGGPPVLALGGDLRGAVCLTRDDLAFPGPHLGDLAQAANLAFLEESVAHLSALLAVEPQILVHDLHPDYRSSRFAQKKAGVPTLAVQHHHAHILSCLAENGHDGGPVLGLALDGTGHGADGTSWGGEILVVDGLFVRRAAHLRPIPLPGGDRVAREPWRSALVLLREAFGAGWREHADLPVFRRVPPGRLEAVTQLLDGPMAPRLPRSSGLGRLLDGCAALVGLCAVNDYDGQAPMELEAAAAPLRSREEIPPYPWSSSASAEAEILELAPAIRALAADVRAARPAPEIAWRVHRTVVDAFATTAERIAKREGLAHVALSGGAFHNVILLEGTAKRLSAAGLRVLTQRRVPAGDGGLSLGQAWAGLLLFGSCCVP